MRISIPVILSLVLLSSGCTTALPRPEPVSTKPLRVQPAKAPAECTRQSIRETFDKYLTKLPAGYNLWVPEVQAKALLTNKAIDAGFYRQLWERALHCAPQS